MLGYIKKVLQKYTHEVPKRPQRSPYLVAPIKCGKGAQDSIPEDITGKVSEEEVLKVQQVVGSIIYYVRAMNLMALISPSTIVSEQLKATGRTI